MIFSRRAARRRLRPAAASGSPWAPLRDALVALRDSRAVRRGTVDLPEVMNPRGRGLAGWPLVGSAQISAPIPDACEHVFVYRRPSGKPGVDLWLAIPVLWFANPGMGAPATWQELSAKERRDALIRTQPMWWTGVGFDAFIDETLARAQLSTLPTPEHRAHAQARARTVLHLTAALAENEPTLAQAQFMAALRLDGIG